MLYFTWKLDLVSKILWSTAVSPTTTTIQFITSNYYHEKSRSNQQLPTSPNKLSLTAYYHLLKSHINLQPHTLTQQSLTKINNNWLRPRKIPKQPTTTHRKNPTTSNIDLLLPRRIPRRPRSPATNNTLSTTTHYHLPPPTTIKYPQWCNTIQKNPLTHRDTQIPRKMPQWLTTTVCYP